MRQDLKAIRYNIRYWEKVKRNLETIPDAYDPMTMYALNNLVASRIDELNRAYRKAQRGREVIINQL